MKTDFEISRDAEVRDIREVASDLGLEEEDLMPYGRNMAKVPLDVLRRYDDRPDGRLILTTAITATPAGEGKTVTTIGLVQGMGRLGKRVMGALREPSLGPIFGIKGGATGGGHSQVYPMWDINLHFTGDIHAVGAAHNLLSAMIENHVTKRNELDIDPTKILFRKAMDMNCRELRHIVVGLGGRSTGGVPHESGFLITSASEISAILALSTSLDDLRERLGRMIVAYDQGGRPVRASQLGCVGAMMVLLKDAIHPNLVQTLEGQPIFIHGFPFANIAHGSNSILATRYALKMADYVVTEGGFAADLGAEKFFDIVCREGGFRPDCAVLVASVRALKMHGGLSKEECESEDLEALERGFANLDRHVDNIRRFGVPVVVAINEFECDTGAEVALVREHCASLGVRAALSRVFQEGGEGGEELAKTVLEVIEENENDFRFLYDTDLTIAEKIEIIAKEIYGAKDVKYNHAAEVAIEKIEQFGENRLPICMAKTQASLSDDPKLKGAPIDWKLTVRELFVSAGAGFIVPVCGQMMLIPGLPSRPAALEMDLTSDGRIVGLR